jgi:hypothetical protein
VAWCRAGLALAGLFTLLAGCGSRTPAPQIISPAAPGGFHVARYPAAGFRLALPRDWTAVPVRPPLVALLTSGPAVISVWRYREAGEVPRTPLALHQAEQRLLAAARSRDLSLQVLRAATAPVAGLPAVELETVQMIGHLRRRVRSIHVYRPGEEVVLEEYAPPAGFGSLDRSVFSAVRRSLLPLRR